MARCLKITLTITSVKLVAGQRYVRDVYE